MENYNLKCLHPNCSKTYNSDTYRLKCDHELENKHGPSLLRAEYETKQITMHHDLPGSFSFIDWLPTNNTFLNVPHAEFGNPYCYKSEGLSKKLGLENLYIAYSGHWPGRKDKLLTKTFKELEAPVTIARYLETIKNNSPYPFIIPSAGNTACAYSFICHLLGIPLYLVVPQESLDSLALPVKTNSFVITVQGDYTDAICLAEQLLGKTNLKAEGGVKNVARRAGMGTVMLNAVVHPTQGSKKMFHHYFQAVGSGAGAIGAWEAVQLLLQDGRFGQEKTKINIAQNAPYTPLIDSWEKGSRQMIPIDEAKAREAISSVKSKVLTTRKPPYSIAGGVFDTLSESSGSAWRVENEQIEFAQKLFLNCEGVSIGTASGVALGALLQARESQKINPDERILLHITDGLGEEKEHATDYTPVPNVLVNPGEVDKALSFIDKVQPINDWQKLLKKF